MRGINRVMLAGHLGAKPEMKKSQGGKDYTYLSLATKRSVKKNEVWDYDTDWHSITVWGRDAGFCVKHLDKGDPVFVDGILSRYQKKKDNGETAWITSIKAHRIEGLKGKPSPPNPQAELAPPF